MSVFYTYIYRDPSRNMEPFYVGKGSKIRALGHHRRTDKHPFVQRLQKMKRESVQPDIELIQALDEEHAYFMERCLIDVLGRKNLDKGPLLNLCDGGRGPVGMQLSEETKRKIGDASKGRVVSEETRQKTRRSMLGKPQSPEKGAKISASKKGVKFSKAHCAAIAEARKRSGAKGMNRLVAYMGLWR